MPQLPIWNLLPPKARWAAFAGVLFIAAALWLGFGGVAPRDELMRTGDGVFDRARRLRTALDALGVNEMLMLLMHPRASRAADLVIQELMKDPGLRRRWDELVARDPNRVRRALLAEMRGEAGFAELLDQIKKTPEFEEELDVAVVESILETVRRTGSAGVSASAQKSDRMMVATDPVKYEEEERRVKQAQLRARPAFQGARRAQGARNVSAMGAFGDRSAGEGAVLHGAVAHATAHAGGEGATQGPQGVTGPEAHLVERKLAVLDSAGPGRNAVAAISSLCYRGDPGITKGECQTIDNYLGEYGLWESCVKSSLYEKCRSLCQDKPELGCGTPPNFYQICESLGEPNCAARCLMIPGCVVPAPPGPPGPGGPGGPPGGGCVPADPCSPSGTIVSSEERFADGSYGPKDEYNLPPCCSCDTSCYLDSPGRVCLGPSPHLPGVLYHICTSP